MIFLVEAAAILPTTWPRGMACGEGGVIMGTIFACGQW